MTYGDVGELARRTASGASRDRDACITILNDADSDTPGSGTRGTFVRKCTNFFFPSADFFCVFFFCLLLLLLFSSS